VCLIKSHIPILQGSQISLNDHDAKEPHLSDNKLLPDTASLADKLKGCLQVWTGSVSAVTLSHLELRLIMTKEGKEGNSALKRFT